MKKETNGIIKLIESVKLSEDKTRINH